MCGMVKPSFIPPANIHQLKDLVKYCFKLTCMITGEKNRAHNCITGSNLKLDDAISPEKAVKLRQFLNHIDELENHKEEIEREIFRLSDKYEAALTLIRTVPGFDKNPLTAI